MAAAGLLVQMAAEHSQASAQNSRCLFEKLVLGVLQPGLYQARLLFPERGYSEKRSAVRGDAFTLGNNAFRDGEGNNLQGRQHAFRFGQGIRRNGGQGHGFIDHVEGVEPAPVEDGNPESIGANIGASGKGLADGSPGSGHSRGQTPRRFVFGHVVRLQAGGKDAANLRRL